jgi:hypothetical protein
MRSRLQDLKAISGDLTGLKALMDRRPRHLSEDDEGDEGGGEDEDTWDTGAAICALLEQSPAFNGEWEGDNGDPLCKCAATSVGLKVQCLATFEATDWSDEWWIGFRWEFNPCRAPNEDPLAGSEADNDYLFTFQWLNLEKKWEEVFHINNYNEPTRHKLGQVPLTYYDYACDCEVNLNYVFEVRVDGNNLGAFFRMKLHLCHNALESDEACNDLIPGSAGEVWGPWYNYQEGIDVGSERAVSFGLCPQQSILISVLVVLGVLAVIGLKCYCRRKRNQKRTGTEKMGKLQQAASKALDTYGSDSMKAMGQIAGINNAPPKDESKPKEAAQNVPQPVQQQAPVTQPMVVQPVCVGQPISVAQPQIIPADPNAQQQAGWLGGFGIGGQGAPTKKSQLLEIKELLDDGLITQEDYDKKKEAILTA